MSVITILNILSGLFSSKIILFLAVVLILVFFIAVYLFYKFSLKQYLINRCNKEETWLPVVDDVGNIIGRVAQSVSLENPGKFQHPLIRIIVWCDGKIYLKQRSSETLFEQGKVDHPFENVLNFGKSIESILEDIHKNYAPDGDEPLFLLKYGYENSEGKWQVLLYYINFSDESKLKSLNFGQGKLWTLQQVRDNLGKSYFSNIFENERPFSAVLLEKY